MLLVAPASADWNVGDGHKMHFPQLPDPNGWDVDFTARVLADDFQCTQSGLITDVHFWASWAYDEIPSDPNGLQGIGHIGLGIFDNVPGGSASFSKPGNLLWIYDVGRNFTVHPEQPSLQGWYEPAIGEETFDANNHSQYFQYNMIIPDANAFYQEANTIYWLAIGVLLNPEPAAEFKVGWKTSTDHWMDDAVWLDVTDGNHDPAFTVITNTIPQIGWQELRDPVTGESMDLAFVITPEPATLAVLGVGGVMFLRRRRRRALA